MELIEEYKSRFGDYDAFTKCVESLLKTLLREASIRPHSINGRVKDSKSLEAKIKRPNKSYTSLDQITDICGIRIITYFSEEVDLAAKLVEKEFVVDSQNSVDKRIFSDPDRFGYVSLHYVVSLNPTRLALAEYRRFNGFKVEIQIRTVIQHAWAEIEHDLGYKRELGMPKAIRRKFFRLSAMFEMADEEFTSIKQTLAKYEHEVSQAITTKPQTVEIDATSIREYIQNSAILKSCDEKIAGAAKLKLIDQPAAMYERDAAYLKWIGIKTIDEIDAFLKANNEIVAALAVNNLKVGNYNTMFRGLSMLYAIYVILARRESPGHTVDFLMANGFGPEEYLPKIAQENFDFVHKHDSSA